ncbi:helix-turn-helix transcriptional regulator [Shewanella sp. KX20019]|uniref:helix-turn-helix domain-containing protein n=1 Tax=Shewanella sp. KX20019 TaxID=2803864 RepID=UPI001925F86D|nr:AraC family transcriptional regulator [Shewanella sp. KX20019]QQX78693.1 helix-turn-helix transcriptional regulator [Shewanella sp. KX20019]
MHQVCSYKPHLMVGDQSYPAYELRNLVNYLKKHFGRSAAAQLCRDIGVTETELVHSQFVYVWQVDYAMTYLQNVSNDAEVGVKAASDYKVADLGFLLSYLAKFNTLGECLEFVIAHPELVGSFSDIFLRNEEGALKVRWLNTNKLETDKYSCQFQHSIGSLMTFAEELTGEKVQAKEIILAEPKRQTEFLASRTGANIQFDGQFFEWSIEQKFLMLPITFSFENVDLTPEISLAQSYITDVLAVLRECAPQLPSMESMAVTQEISTRTLRRRLSAAGTNYQKLIDQVRCQMAVNLILSSEHSIEAISDLMGFGDISHFRQSFKHWIGHPPGHFHRLHQGESKATNKD